MSGNGRALTDRPPDRPPDRRVERSRAAILSAFNRLILERGFDKLTAADVAEAANVGRSTFYAHYTGLAELLSEAVSPILTPLAMSVLGEEPRLQPILEHIWENRVMGRNLFAGEMRRRLTQILASKVQDLLEGEARASGRASAAVAALQIAGGQLTMLEAWLAGRTPATVVQMARQLRGGSAAIAAAWLSEPPER
jgi:AcrR family transcriptional regulator